MSTKRKKYSCDFETTTDPKDCRVWAYGWMEILEIDDISINPYENENNLNYKLGNSLNEFMDWVFSSEKDLYYHNLKFDGAFILSWLLNHGFEPEYIKYTEKKPMTAMTFRTTITTTKQYYMFEICYGYKGKKKEPKIIRIYDSLKKLPFKVEKIAKDFKLPTLKGNIDYNEYRAVNHELTDEEKSYLKNDIQIIANALSIQFYQKLSSMTIGSDCFSFFKHRLKEKHGKNHFENLFPVLTMECDTEIRESYRGGFTWVNEQYQGKTIYTGTVYDVNSLYPSVMYDRYLPVGVPELFDGEYEKDELYPLYIQYVKISFDLKPNHIPTVQLKGTMLFKDNEYIKTTDGEMIPLWLTNVDLELLQQHYDVEEIVYCGGYKFRQQKGIFKDYIDFWMGEKKKYSKEKNAQYQIAKLMLNSLYGKFATNPNVTGVIPYIKEDRTLGFKNPLDDNGNKLEDLKDPIYTAIACFITAYARQFTISTAQKCFDRILYCDTDSIHLVGFETPEVIKDIIHPSDLGLWKHEYNFKKGKFLRQKTYVEEVFAKEIEIEVDGEKKTKIVECDQNEATTTLLTVKCAGMPEQSKEHVTFDNFKIGLTVPDKLLPKQVPNGVVLLNTEFTIK